MENKNQNQTWLEISNEIHASKKALKAKQQKGWLLFLLILVIVFFVERSSNPVLFIVIASLIFIILVVFAPWGKIAKPNDNEVRDYAKNQLKMCGAELEKLKQRIQKLEEILGNFCLCDDKPSGPPECFFQNILAGHFFLY